MPAAKSTAKPSRRSSGSKSTDVSSQGSSDSEQSTIPGLTPTAPSTDSTTTGVDKAKDALTPSQKKKQILQKARSAAERAEREAADAEAARRLRLSEFIKKIRGVSEEHPEGRISQRQLGQEMGIGFASIRNYEAMENSPQRIKHATFERIAKFGGCSADELRAYVMYGEYKPSISREDVAAFLRWSSLDDILFVLQAASSAAQQKINEASKAQ